MSPSADEISWSERLVETYRKGLEEGIAAITLDGKWLTVHQYTTAQETLRRAELIRRRAA
jgi:citrate lyase beta subunit